MSLKFGLNVKSKPAADDGPRRTKRATIFDDELDAGSDESDDKSKGGNVFGEEEELTEFDASALKKSSRPSAPAPKSKAGNKLRPGAPPSKPPVRKPKPLLDDDDDEEGTQFGDLSSMRDVKAVASKAEEVDPTIYDYDAFHTAHSSVQQQRKAADRQDAIERKPKYIGKLLDAAARRKQDQLVAREKLLQKERENEGDEFADKEKFVTGAYKAQQAETQRLEEEEKKKAEQEEERRRRNGGGLQGFYRNLMGEEDKRHQEAIEAAAKLERGEVPTSTVAADEDKTKTDADIAAEMRAKGVNVHINDEGQVSDKRQLLSAGLNIAPAVGKGGPGAHSADHLKSSNQKNRENAFQTGRYDRNDQKSMRERQTRMLEHQLEESAKRKREEEEEERKALEEKSKSRKTEADVSSARERYLARKKAQEEAKKNKGTAA